MAVGSIDLSRVNISLAEKFNVAGKEA